MKKASGFAAGRLFHFKVLLPIAHFLLLTPCSLLIAPCLCGPARNRTRTLSSEDSRTIHYTTGPKEQIYSLHYPNAKF